VVLVLVARVLSSRLHADLPSSHARSSHGHGPLPWPSGERLLRRVTWFPADIWLALYAVEIRINTDVCRFRGLCVAAMVWVVVWFFV